MKNFLLLSYILIYTTSYCYSQDTNNFFGKLDENESKYMVGFSFALQGGTWPETALTNMNMPLDKVTSYSFGVIIQRKITNKFSAFFDANTYNYNFLVGKMGTDVQSAWTLGEGATHWDEPGAPQTLKVNNLPTDVYYDMQSTGVRLGVKYYFPMNKINPWIGLGYGYYVFNANYFDESKKKTYGEGKGSTSDLTYNLGVDFEAFPGIIITPFLDLTSPVGKYEIKGLFYPQWNNEEIAKPIMGTYRFGLTLNFTVDKPKKK